MQPEDEVSLDPAIVLDWCNKTLDGVQVRVKNTFIDCFQSTDKARKPRSRSLPPRCVTSALDVSRCRSISVVEPETRSESKQSDGYVCMPEEQQLSMNLLPVPVMPWIFQPAAGIYRWGEESPGGNAPLPVSIGTCGHPDKCASPCKYVRKKTGCRDGAACKNCHTCPWRRTSTARTRSPQAFCASFAQSDTNVSQDTNDCLTLDNRGVVALVSIGTQGHPHCCGPPCKYVRRKTGCRDGEACTNCHACRWRRTSLQQVPPPPPPRSEHPRPGREASSGQGWRSLVVAVPVGNAGATTRGVPTISVGTVGHPQTCGLPCKYESRKTGCRDGVNCFRCHECCWQSLGGEPTTPTDGMADSTIPADSLRLFGKTDALGVAAESGGSTTDPCSDTSSDGDTGVSTRWSKGSSGHPQNCGQACKYSAKSSGCKDGLTCTRCHFCRWSRGTESTSRHRLQR